MLGRVGSSPYSKNDLSIKGNLFCLSIHLLCFFLLVRYSGHSLLGTPLDFQILYSHGKLLSGGHEDVSTIASGLDLSSHSLRYTHSPQQFFSWSDL